MNVWVLRRLMWAALLLPVSLLAADLPDSGCLECHGQSDLAKTNDTGRVISLFTDAAKLKASVHGTNTCASCHSDLTDKHPDDDIAAKPVNCSQCHAREGDSYGASAHAIAQKAGKPGVATCEACHGSHDIASPKSAQSPLHVSRQAQTCGECHTTEAQEFAESIHGKALAAGVREAPTCTDCHSEHKIESLKTKAARNISEDVCSRCHASERINTKFNLPHDRVRTFFNSYHGLASQYGSTVAAHCGSCHGSHKILPSKDPNSTINKAHLVETCGKCHVGANENFALSKVHVDIASARSGDDLGGQINWWARRIYLVLIAGTIGGMLAHNLLLFRKKISAHLTSTGRPVSRMTRSQRWQHAILAISFIILAVSGFALKFPDSGIAHILGASEPFRRWVHRIAGVVLLLVGVYHLIYLVRTREGWQLLKDFLPVKKDLSDVFASVRYLVGLSPRKPQIARFGYAEKMEYWAVVWGTIIMGVTGFLIWFKIDVTRHIPRWAVDVALTIHYYEAVLACLAIVVWHFYHVIFDPDVYPLNMACWDGQVSEQWQDEEHPLDRTSRNSTSTPAPPGPGHNGDGPVHSREAPGVLSDPRKS